MQYLPIDGRLIEAVVRTYMLFALEPLSKSSGALKNVSFTRLFALVICQLPGDARNDDP